MFNRKIGAERRLGIELSINYAGNCDDESLTLCLVHSSVSMSGFNYVTLLYRVTAQRLANCCKCVTAASA